jgi:hypothetical protein
MKIEARCKNEIKFKLTFVLVLCFMLILLNKSLVVKIIIIHHSSLTGSVIVIVVIVVSVERQEIIKNES